MQFSAWLYCLAGVLLHCERWDLQPDTEKLNVCPSCQQLGPDISREFLE